MEAVRRAAARKVVDQQMHHAAQSEVLEAQAVEGGKYQETLRRKLLDDLFDRRGRIWKEL